MVKVQRGLGKGLSALIQETNTSSVAVMERPAPQAAAGQGQSPFQMMSVSNMAPSIYQPRQYFSEQELQELAHSIEKKGVVQPLIVRASKTGGYEIIAGERRWRASQMAGLKEVPVIVKSLTDDDALEIALIENVQRQDLNPLEEARGYDRLVNEFQYTQEEIAESVGKSRSHIANLIRLLKLPEDVKTLLETGKLTMGHARALLTSENPSELAQKILRENLNVRGAEAIAKGQAPAPRQSRGKSHSKSQGAGQGRDKDPDILALEETLTQNLGLKVAIEDRGSAGEVIISYETLAQLDQVLQRLSAA